MAPYTPLGRYMNATILCCLLPRAMGNTSAPCLNPLQLLVSGVGRRLRCPFLVSDSKWTLSSVSTVRSLSSWSFSYGRSLHFGVYFVYDSYNPGQTIAFSCLKIQAASIFLSLSRLVCCILSRMLNYEERGPQERRLLH